MGFDQDGIRFLLQSSADFTTTATIGRQNLHLTEPELQELLSKHHIPVSAREMLDYGGDCTPFLKALGAQEIVSVDASGYEGATHLHDLNLPLPESLSERFTAVIDAGSLEHVFNFPQALKSCMEMLKEEGRMILMTPANNFCGHGFYQFSPEVFYRAFSEANGFEVERMWLAEQSKPWKRVPDARKVRKRVLVTNSNWTYLLVQAKRKEIKEVFSKWPQQSDYEDAWQGDEWHLETLWL